MSSEYVNFTPVFQERLLALLAQRPDIALAMVKPEYFTLPMHSEIAKLIHAVYADKDPKLVRLTPSTFGQLVRLKLKALRKGADYDSKKEYLRTAKALLKMKLRDSEILIEHAHAFAIHSRYQAGLVEAEQLVNSRNYREVSRLFVELESKSTGTPSQAELPVFHLGKFIRSDDLAIDSSDYLVCPIIPKRGAVLLFGLPKELKSWMAAALSIDAATGRKALGYFDVPKPVNTLYVQVEDTPALTRTRLSQLNQNQGMNHTVSQFMMKVIPRSDVNLSDPDKLASFIRVIEKHKPKLLVLDVLRRLFRGSVVDTKETAQFLSTLDIFRDKFGCAVLLVHHARKGESAEMQSKALGSINLTAWADVLMYVSGKKVVNGASVSKLQIESKAVTAEHDFVLTVNEENCPMVSVTTQFESELESVISLLERDPGLTQVELRNKLKYPDKKLRSVLKRAVEKEVIIEKRGRRKTLHYFPNPKTRSSRT